MSAKFDALIAWLKDLEDQENRIHQEIDRVCEMLDHEQSGEPLPKGSTWIECPDHAGLIDFWIAHVGDYPDEIAKATRVST